MGSQEQPREYRPTRMDRGTRKLMSGLVLGALVPVLVVCLGQGRNPPVAPQEVRAKKFVLVDDTGKERAELAILDDGAVRLIVRDQRSSASIWLGVDAAGRPSLVLSGADGNRAMDLVVLRGEQPAVILRDKSGKRRLIAGIVDSGFASVVLFDENGKDRQRMMLDKRGNPRLILSDGSGHSRARIMLDSTGVSSIALSDTKRTRITMQVAADGPADMALFDSNDRAAWIKVAR